jgi:hypothetical protein
MYRPGIGDRDYFPLARQFAEGHFGEGYTFEKLNEGRVGFPAMSVLPHGLAMKMFGPTGFAVVDILTPVAYFALGTWLLVRTGSQRGPAIVLAFLATQPAFSWFANLLVAHGGVLRHGAPFFLDFLQSWQLRFPRTFVTDLYVLGTVGQLVELGRAGPAVNLRWWVATAVWAAVLLQSDTYAFVALSLAASAIGFACTFRPAPFAVRDVARRAALGFAVFLVVASPFIYSRFHDLPDIQARYGVFSLERWRIAEFTGIAFGFFLPRFVIFAFVLPWLMWWLLRRCNPTSDAGLRVATVLTLLQLGGLFALPAFVTLTGKGVQLYHFRDVAHTLSGWSALACLALMGSVVLDRIGARFRAGRVGAGVAGAALMFVSVMPAWSLAKTHVENAGLPRAAGILSPAWARTYREDWRQLGRELARVQYVNARVLATPDVEIYSWWTAFRGGYAFLPHIFVSALPESDLLHRLTLFARLNQLDRDGFLRWLTASGVNGILGNWLSGDRYQANRLYSAAPLNDYTADERARIAATDALECWHLIIPRSERHRLGAAFDESANTIHQPLPRLDLLVLTQEFPELRPDPRRFSLTYANAIFRLYVARPHETVEANPADAP